MAIRKKIDSNETSLSYAEEESIGVLGSTPIWHPLEPNEYDDFGGDMKLIARNPINQGRQRKKGKLVDLDAAGGFTQDFTLFNSPDIMQGFMFADTRKKKTAAVTGTTSGFYTVAAGAEAGFVVKGLIFASGFTTPALNGLKKVAGANSGQVGVTGVTASAETGTITLVGYEADADDMTVTSVGGLVKFVSADVSFLDLGLVGGEYIFIGGDSVGTQYASAGNNGFKRIRNVLAGSVVIDTSAAPMVADAGTGKTIRFFIGDFLKNEVGSLIKRRSYNLERTLGAPDTDHLDQVQAEYIVGSVPNMLTIDAKTADKLTMKMSFVGQTNETRTAAEGVKAGTRATLIEADAFNTSSDVNCLRINVVDPANNSPTALFAYITDFSIEINNNVSPNKAIGVLGAFDMTAGTFEISATTSAYFDTVAMIAAVKANKDVQLYGAFALDNTGFVLDIPLIAPAGGKPDIKQDEPIMIPLKADAATAAKLSGDLNHTLSWTFFKYLPTLAS